MPAAATGHWCCLRSAQPSSSQSPQLHQRLCHMPAGLPYANRQHLRTHLAASLHCCRRIAEASTSLAPTPPPALLLWVHLGSQSHLAAQCYHMLCCCMLVCCRPLATTACQLPYRQQRRQPDGRLAHVESGNGCHKDTSPAVCSGNMAAQRSRATRFVVKLWWWWLGGGGGGG